MSDEMLKLAEQVDWQMRYYGDVRFGGDAAKLVQAALRAAAASPIADFVAAAGEYRPSSAEEIAAAEEAFRVAAASAEPVAWRYRATGSQTWIYEPDSEWISKYQASGIEREPLYTHPAPEAQIVAALEENCWDLRCIDVPTGGGDADVSWNVVEHHMAPPKERIVGFGKSPREAISAALAKAKGVRSHE